MNGWAVEYREYIEEGERIVRERRPIRWSESEWAAEMIAAFHREHRAAPNAMPVRSLQRLPRLRRRADGRCALCPRPAMQLASRCWHCYKAARRQARRAA